MGRLRRWLRPLAASALAGVLAWRVGPGAIAQAAQQVDAGSLGLAVAAAVAVAGVTTVCVAWRWVLVARGFGLSLALPHAVAASYRAQFLNVTLPAGVAGDVHRAVAHGRSVGDVARGAYAVVCERAIGQVVQIALAVAALTIVPSPLQWAAGPPWRGAGMWVLAGVGLVVIVGLGVRRRPGRRESPADPPPRDARSQLSPPVFSPRVWSAAVVMSVLAVSGHVGTFLLAVRAAGVTETPSHLVPLALLVLLAAAVPLNLGGWGPREGAAAWAFGAAGLGADHGLVVAALYGTLVIAASLPGAVVILCAATRRDRTLEPTSAGRTYA